MESNTWQIRRDLSKPQSGIPGVTWNTSKGCWRVRCSRVASISLDGGEHDSLSEAVSARRRLKIKCTERKPLVFLPEQKTSKAEAKRMHGVLKGCLDRADLDPKDRMALERIEAWLANLVTV